MSDVVVRVEGACGRLTLNRPRAMNALSLEMVRTMAQALRAWADDPAVQFTLLEGAGDRGLCAGGDIRALYEAVRSAELGAAATFFREEYELNSLIAGYAKPYVALMDGVVMGGGIGVSAHGSRRVVTERSSLAMPETGIGFIPDVGGTYLLGTAPDELGTYMALTSARIGAADAIDVGLADMFVVSSDIPALIERLEPCRTAAEVDDCLRASVSKPPAGLFETQRTWIKECFAAPSVEAILAALHTQPATEAQQAALDIETKSPTSLKVTLHALRKARRVNNLNACLREEYKLALACLHHHDFVEGVRAAVVDKDRNPRWSPAALAEVTPAEVDHFFVNNGLDDLHLDPRAVTAAEPWR